MAYEENLNHILNQFVPGSSLSEFGDGHINDTYLVDSGDYILQRINTGVFENPEKLMDNIVSVTEFLQEKIRQSGGDPERETLTVVKTLDGKNLYTAKNGQVYRCYKYIAESVSVTDCPSLKHLYNAAKGFGRFGSMLDDYPADSLFEVIPDFHNTPKRFKAFKSAVLKDLAQRARLVGEEINFVLSQEDWIGTVTDGIADGSIPLRVTHNDTKINNVLFDRETGEAICVIDLDTVMPGSMLYDFGDALRVGAATAAEDETDLSKVHFSREAFEVFTKGYFEEMLPKMTEAEIEYLPLSAKLLTFECGMRFLTDYLNGDTYFKIHRPNHNLDRARSQFKLVRDIAAQEEDLKKLVKEIQKNIK